MDKFKIVMATLAVIALVGCGDSNDNTNGEQGISVDDILGVSTENNDTNEETKNDDGTAVTDEEVIKTNITSDPTNAVDTFQTVSVGYTLKSSSLPVCYNTIDVRLDYDIAVPTYTCRWLCGVHEGDGPIEVELIFTKPNSWVLTDEKLSTASSRCN